jgi:hypothetical protein
LPHLPDPGLQVYQNFLTLLVHSTPEPIPGEESVATLSSPLVCQAPKKFALAEKAGPLLDHGLGVYVAADAGRNGPALF